MRATSSFNRLIRQRATLLELCWARCSCKHSTPCTQTPCSLEEGTKPSSRCRSPANSHLMRLFRRQNWLKTVPTPSLTSQLMKCPSRRRAFLFMCRQTSVTKESSHLDFRWTRRTCGPRTLTCLITLMCPLRKLKSAMETISKQRRILQSTHALLPLQRTRLTCALGPKARFKS